MRLIEGDITRTELNHIIHGCNAQGKMNSGVAKAIREAFPGNYESYCLWLDSFQDPTLALGQFITHTDMIQGKHIHNLITQLYYGFDGRKYASYTDLVVGMHRIISANFTVANFAIPKIGSGLGGLKWDIVAELLKELEDRHRVEFWVYELATS